jgi:5-formyltetrahydrofolate cyclo-ligase
MAASPLVDSPAPRPYPLQRTAAGAAPLYHQVFLEVESLALNSPLDDDRPLPPEPVLMARFGVSRGTLRRAVDELCRQGLLRSEPGRGTFVDKATQVRRLVRSRLAEVARPDSRFHDDLSQFVPDFDGSGRCVDHVRALPAYRSARHVFVAPDNSLEGLRRQALDDGKTLLVPSFGMRRGVVRLDPRRISATRRELAATLDGMERLGETLTLEGIRRSAPVQLFVTGALAVTRPGRHIGGGQAYVDLEWGLLRELGLVDADVPTVVVVHGCQVLESGPAPGPLDCPMDVIATPDGAEPTVGGFPKPTGIDWSRLDPGLLQSFAYLRALAEDTTTHRSTA